MIRSLTLKYFYVIVSFISRFGDFALYLDTQLVGVLTYSMYNMIETFKPSVVISYS